MRARSFYTRKEMILFPMLGALALGLGSSCTLDPVHKTGVNALGPERDDSYPPKSEFHRPGEPCALCHSDKGPADSIYVLAGTVFWGPDKYERRVDQAYVRVIDADKTKKCFVTNCNGNFFVKQQDYPRIKFPLLVSVERTKQPGTDESTLVLRRMGSHIGDEASCAVCHIQGLRDYGSPGQIRLFDTEAQVPQDQLTKNCPKDEPAITLCPEDRL